MCHCGNTGVARTLNKSQHRKLTLKKKISPADFAGIRTHNLLIASTVLYQQAILAPQHSASQSANVDGSTFVVCGCALHCPLFK